MDNYINCSDSEVKFKQTDAFIGFQKDTPASVIFQASNLLKSATAAVRAGVNVVGGKWERIFQWSNVEKSFWNMTEEQNHETWKEAVSILSESTPVHAGLPPAVQYKLISFVGAIEPAISKHSDHNI